VVELVTHNLRIYWTNFHQIVTIWQAFGRRLLIHPSFSDRSRDVAIAINFRVKIGKIAYCMLSCPLPFLVSQNV